MPRIDQDIVDELLHIDGMLEGLMHPGIAGQAFDRGAEAAMRVLKAERWIENNVGLN